MIESLLKTLCAELEIDSLPIKEEDGSYPFALSPEITIQIKELDPGLSFFSKIAPCPQLKKEELFMYLMKANLLGQGTGGSTLAMDENENFLTLSLVLPYDMNYKMFKDALEDFANYLDFWRNELIRHQKLAETSLH